MNRAQLAPGDALAALAAAHAHLAAARARRLKGVYSVQTPGHDVTSRYTIAATGEASGTP